MCELKEEVHRMGEILKEIATKEKRKSFVVMEDPRKKDRNLRSAKSIHHLEPSRKHSNYAIYLRESTKLEGEEGGHIPRKRHSKYSPPLKSRPHRSDPSSPISPQL